MDEEKPLTAQQLADMQSLRASKAQYEASKERDQANQLSQTEPAYFVAVDSVTGLATVTLSNGVQVSDATLLGSRVPDVGEVVQYVRGRGAVRGSITAKGGSTLQPPSSSGGGGGGGTTDQTARDAAAAAQATANSAQTTANSAQADADAAQATADAAQADADSAQASAAAAQSTANSAQTSAAAAQATANAALPKAGGTMTGALVLAADPTADLEAATKQYVDANSGGTAAPETATITTASLAPGAHATGTVVIAKRFDFLGSCSVTALDNAGAGGRIRLYTTPADRTADLNRAAGVFPSDPSPILLDLVTPTGSGLLSAKTNGAASSDETPPATAIAYTVSNTGAVATRIQVAINYQSRD